MKTVTPQPSQETTTAPEQLAERKTQLPKARVEGAGPGPPFPAGHGEGHTPPVSTPRRPARSPVGGPGPARWAQRGRVLTDRPQPRGEDPATPAPRLQQPLPRSKSRAGGPGYILRPAPPLAARDSGRGRGTPSAQGPKLPWTLSLCRARLSGGGLFCLTWGLCLSLGPWEACGQDEAGAQAGSGVSANGGVESL